MDAARFLVIDGYNREARDELVAGGASRAGESIRRDFREREGGTWRRHGSW